MKLILFVLSVFCAGLSFGQEDPVIKNIRYETGKIDMDKTLVKVVIGKSEEFLGQATPNASELTGYFKGSQLMKIKSSISFSWGYLEDEYYFMNDKLLYVYQKERRFVFDPETGELTNQLNTVFSGSFYFSMEKIIREDVAGLKQADAKKDWRAAFPKDAKKYAALLKARKG